jgi:hypothetical protein
MLKRPPRKKIRASQAAQYFSLTTRTFIRRCREGIYPLQLIPGDTPNSPYFVWEREVAEHAKNLGII